MSRPGVTATVKSNTIDWSYFVRVDIASPVGTQRFTNRRSGDFTGNIDGTVQTWSAADVIVGSMDQSTQNPSNVSWVDFANLGNPPQWTTWANSPGLKNVPLTVYVGVFLATGALDFSYTIYKGQIASGEFLERARLALKPPAPWWTRQAPWVTIKQLGFGPLMPAPGTQIVFGGDPIPRVIPSPVPNNATPSQRGQNPLADYGLPPEDLNGSPPAPGGAGGKITTPGGTGSKLGQG